MPDTHIVTLPGQMLQRGFWLYVWRVETAGGDVLYVGRTGDNSSPHASAPYTRMGQHLGSIKTQNALRKHLNKRGIDPRDCPNLHLISHGPIYPEIVHVEGVTRAALMNTHRPLRDVIGAMEKALAEQLTAVGYDVLNQVKWKPPLDLALWEPVRAAFAVYFPKLRDASL